jgi:hypothetical protein
LPGYVREECYASLQCGILAHGCVRLGCGTCPQKMWLACSCKRRGFCPSCAGRRMAQLAAHRVAQVIPWVPPRQWVVSVPVPLRDWMASSKDLTAAAHTSIRRTISQYDVNEAVTRGVDRKTAQAGSVTCVHRVGGGDQSPCPLSSPVFRRRLCGSLRSGAQTPVCHDRPPSDAEIARVVHQISRQIIRTLRRLGYLEAGSAAPHWGWARLLTRVFAFAMARCPACGRGTLRIIAAVTHAAVIRKILRHLTRATDPPPIAPARAYQDRLAWASPSPANVSSHVP